MPNPISDVRDFQQKYNPNDIAHIPSWPTFDTMRKYSVGIELTFKHWAESINKTDFPDIVVDSVDAIRITFALLYAMGVDVQTVWDIVHNARIEGNTGKVDIQSALIRLSSGGNDE